MTGPLHLSTILTRSPASVLLHLSRLNRFSSSNPFLFTLSTNLPDSDLSNLVTHLTSSFSHSVGCLSSPLTKDPELIACSLAVFDENEASVWRSEIPGRPAAQVGRWHFGRDKMEEEENTDLGLGGNGEKVDWEGVWRRDVEGHELPEGLRSLSKEQVNTVLYLSDNAPEGLSNTLSTFPNATKQGLVAASTPFVTGHPFTLFHGKDIFSSGAVGVALTGPGSKARSKLRFPGLKSITPELTVTRAEGNLIHELDAANPSALLLSAIKKHGLQGDLMKEDEFCVGTVRDGRLHQVSRIMSGDPSRGTIALESGAAPPEGAIVRLYHCQNPSTSDLTHEIERSSLAFTRSPFEAHAHSSSSLSSDLEGAERVLEYTFLASSDNGWLLSRSDGGRAEEAWTCTVGGGQACLVWG